MNPSTAATKALTSGTFIDRGFRHRLTTPPSKLTTGKSLNTNKPTLKLTAVNPKFPNPITTIPKPWNSPLLDKIFSGFEFIGTLMDKLYVLVNGDVRRLHLKIVLLDDDHGTVKDKFVQFIEAYEKRLRSYQPGYEALWCTSFVRRNSIGHFARGPPTDDRYRVMLKDCAELLLENEDRWVSSWSYVCSVVDDYSDYYEKMDDPIEGDIQGVEVVIKVLSCGEMNDESVHTREDVLKFLQQLSLMEDKIKGATLKCNNISMTSDKLTQDLSFHLMKPFCTWWSMCVVFQPMGCVEISSNIMVIQCYVSECYVCTCLYIRINL